MIDDLAYAAHLKGTEYNEIKFININIFRIKVKI